MPELGQNREFYADICTLSPTYTPTNTGHTSTYIRTNRPAETRHRESSPYAPAFCPRFICMYVYTHVQIHVLIHPDVFIANCPTNRRLAGLTTANCSLSTVNCELRTVLMRLPRQHKMLPAPRLIVIPRHDDRAVIRRRLPVNQPLRIQRLRPAAAIRHQLRNIPRIHPHQPVQVQHLPKRHTRESPAPAPTPSRRARSQAAAS
jgi:hypothetical protein